MKFNRENENTPILNASALLKVTCTQADKLTIEIVYGIASSNREEAKAERMLELEQGHWSIEKPVARVRKVTLGEDAFWVKSGSASHVFGCDSQHGHRNTEN